MANKINGTIVAHGHNGSEYIGRVLDDSHLGNFYTKIDANVRKRFQETIEKADFNSVDDAIKNADLYHTHILNSVLDSINAINYSTNNLPPMPDYVNKILEETINYFMVVKK